MTLPANWPASALRKYLLGSLIPGSTGLVDTADAAHQVHEARAAGGRLAAQQRHEQMRERIIKVAGALALIPQQRGWAAAVQRRIADNPPQYGFEQAPDMRTIRKAQEHLLQKSGTTLPSCTAPAFVALHTVHTTT